MAAPGSRSATQRAETAAVADLELEAEIGRGAYSVVYRARRNGVAVAVKVFPGLDQNPVAARLFRREASALARLRHPALPRVLEVGDGDGTPYLTMQLIEGRPLRELLRAGALSVESTRRLALEVASALVEVHRHRLVHRDLKPENILLDASGSAKLVDFGFAAPTTAARSETVTATILYAPPEQTGMLERPVDERSDLYSLGAVLFECLTGRPPFSGSDVAELIRRHALAPVPDLRELRPSVPAPLAAVLTRLLAKDPDDRYQSAAGLKADLQALDVLPIDADGRVVVGGYDTAETPEEVALIGRDEERARLTEAWNEVRRNRCGRRVTVAGDMGSGKSRLVRDWMRSLPTDEVLSLAGRCPAGSVPPLAPFRIAFDTLLQNVDRQDPEVAEATRRRLREAAGDLAGVVRQISPRLAALFPDASAPYGVEDLHALLEEAIRQFLFRLALQRPLVLFVDDADRADALTARMLDALSERLEDVPMLLVCAVRSSSQPARSTDVQLWLGNLDESCTVQLVREHLGGNELGDELAQQIALRSGGSPLAVAEVVRALLDSGRLRPHWGRWKLDRDDLARVELPVDTLQLVSSRLDGLSEEATQALRLAALMGSQFSLTLLREAFGGGDSLRAVLAEATTARIVEHHAAGRYAFVHDSLCDALLDGLGAETRRRLHRRIATAYERAGGGDVDDVFAHARHFALGADPADAARVCEVNLAAGRAALDYGADPEAHGFLAEALRAARASGATPPLELCEAMGDASARLGKLDEALVHFDAALSQAHDPMRRAELRIRLAHIHLWGTFDAPQARRQVYRAFGDIGVPAGQPGLRAWGAAFRDWFSGAAMPRRGSRVEHGAEWERSRILARLYLAAAHAAFLDLRPGLMFQTIVRSFSVAARLGPSRELANLYGLYATVWAFFRLGPLQKRYMMRALQVAEEIGDPRAQAQASVYVALAHHYAGRARAAADVMRKCLSERGAWLDAAEFVSGASDLSYNLVSRGYSREALDWFEKALRRSRATEPTHFRRMQPVLTAPAAILATLGRGAEGWGLLEDWRSASDARPRWRFGEARLYALMLLFYLEQGDLGACEDVIARHRALGLRPRLLPAYLRSFYLYQAYVRLAQWMRCEPGSQGRCAAQFADALRELRTVVNVPVLQSHFFLLKGAGERLRGRRRRSRRFFARAETLALEHDCPWVLFEVARQRAHLLAAEGNRALARHYGELAHRIAAEHGWGNRRRWVEEEVPNLGVPHTVGTADRVDPGQARLRRYLDALLQINLAAARVDDFSSGARATLDEVARVLGAERAFLFLVPPGGNELEREGGRDSNGHDLAADAPYSRAVVEQVRSTCRPLVVSGSEEGAVLATESVVAHGLRSILAAPLLLQDRLVGVLYLDNRLVKGAFGSEDVEILMAIGSHIAVTLDKARTAAERDAAARAVLESEANLRSVFDNLVDIFYRTDLDGTVRMISPSVQRYGHRPSDLVGRPVMDFYEHRADRDRLLKELLSNGSVTDFEAQFKRGDGVAVPVSMSARLIFDDAGRPCGMEGLLRDISERKQAEEELEQSRTRLRALSNRLVSVQEEERKRLARDLHDELGQVLTALSLDLNWLAKRTAGVVPEADSRITKMGVVVDDAINTVQRISRELRPMLLDDLGLVPALQWLAREFEERSRIACTLKVPARGVTLDRERGITVFRLVQEALTNVARHSGASRVEVAIRRRPGNLALRIEDDGRGIRPDEIADPHSLGLAGMNERVRLLGGSIRIDGKEGSGTRVEIELPLPQRRRRP